MSHIVGAMAAARLELDARADPMSRFQFKIPARRIVEEMSRGVKVLCLAGNSGAKTTSGIAIDLAFCKGQETLLDCDDTVIALPLIKPPVKWLLGIGSYKLGGPSTLDKIRELLGDWPVHESHSGGPENVTTFAIRHRLSRGDNTAEGRKDWSRLYVFSYDGVIPEAIRLHGWHCDEPPPPRFLDALLNRKIAGDVLRALLTLTPIERDEWEPVLQYFPPEAGKVEQGRLRLQWSVYENRALHRPGCDGKCAGTGRCPDITAAEDSVRGSPWARARLFGDPVDVASSCPFDVETLLWLRSEFSREGRRHVVIERAGMLELAEHVSGDIRVFDDPAPVDRILVVANPCAGVRPERGEKGSHLANLQAFSLAKQAQILRWAGYLTPAEMALMARGVCNAYRSWIFVPEMNGGWGEELLRGFNALEAAPGSFGVIYQDVDPTSTTGQAKTRVGWWQTELKRGASIAALQRAILERSLQIPSYDALTNLMAVNRNRRTGRYDDPETGLHPRDFLVMGMACSIMENPSLVPAEPKPERMTERERFEHEVLRRPPLRDYDGYAQDDVPRW